MDEKFIEVVEQMDKYRKAYSGELKWPANIKLSTW